MALKTGPTPVAGQGAKIAMDSLHNTNILRSDYALFMWLSKLAFFSYPLGYSNHGVLKLVQGCPAGILQDDHSTNEEGGSKSYG